MCYVYFRPGVGVVQLLMPFHEIEVSKNANDVRVLRILVRTAHQPHVSFTNVNNTATGVYI